MPKPRNKPCDCNSGLKYKWCHGDAKKKALSIHVARLLFIAEVADTKVDKGMMTRHDRDEIIRDKVVPDLLRVLEGTTLHNYLEMGVFRKYEDLNNQEG